MTGFVLGSGVLIRGVMDIGAFKGIWDEVLDAIGVFNRIGSD